MRKRRVVLSKIMAVVLSVAMMTTSINVSATEYKTEEVVTEKVTEEVETEETSEALEEKESESVESTTEEAEEESTEETTTEEAIVEKVALFATTRAEKLYAPDSVEGKIDVWDFGAETLDTTKYVNKLSEDIINSWYPEVTEIKSGVNIPKEGFAVENKDGETELIFKTADKTNHKLRTINTNIIAGDYGKSLKDIKNESVIYSGYLYSNANANTDVQLQLKVNEGDKVTFVVSRNNGPSNIVFCSPDGKKTTKTYEGASSQGQEMTFYAGEAGMSTIYSENEKLIVARVYRESMKQAKVSGKVTSPVAFTEGTICFTCEETGIETEVPFSNGVYKNAALYTGYNYFVSLKDANGYVITSDDTLNINKEATEKEFDIKIDSVDLVSIKGQIKGLSTEALEALKLSFESEEIYQPEVKLNGAKYNVKLEKGVKYFVQYLDIDDYTLVSDQQVLFDEDQTFDIVFENVPTYKVTINPVGATLEELENATFTFIRHEDEDITQESAYIYTFTGTKDIVLRDGTYTVKVTDCGDFVQKLTSNVVVDGNEVEKTISFEIPKTPEKVDYKETITVGASECDYTTINDALEAVRNMERNNGERVTIEIKPGDYEEMLVIDVPNVTLKNASKTPSIATKNKGVDIDDNAVRITSYYGHGYTYYSMDSKCKYDEEILAVNKENGYASLENPGSGTTKESYWNATVTIDANGFEAEGIIFENSFNQYISKKAANDKIEKQSGAKEGTVARADMKAGDTTVQDKKYVERAAALAIKNNISHVSFDNCKFIGRQDTLYGGTNVTAAFYGCDIYGGTDYIFGGMTAVFAKCNLVFNTMEDGNDVGYITAAQQKSGRGYLIYNCNVISTTPGVDTASEKVSKPGYLGRPWQANTSEVVFYATNIGQASDGKSLIKEAGWSDGLSGKSDNVFEFGTCEMVKDVDNTSKRVDWAKTYASIENAKLADGTAVSVEAFLGDWDVFAGKDMTIETAQGTIDVPKPDEKPSTPTEEKTYTFESKNMTAFAEKTKADGAEEKVGTDSYFTIIYSAKSKVDTSSKEFEDGYKSDIRVNLGGKAATDKNAVKFTTSSPASVKIWWAAGDNGRQMALLNTSGEIVTQTSDTVGKNNPCVSTLKLADAGTYYLGGDINNNYIFKIEVTETPTGASKPERAAWDTVEKAEITKVALNEKSANEVIVTINANIGYDGADAAVVTMKDKAGKVVDTKKSSSENVPQSVTFTPDASGIYTFQVMLTRENETDKVTEETKEFEFSLPLTTPHISSATSIGNGKAEVVWDAVKEAEKYEVKVETPSFLFLKAKDSFETEETSIILEDLEVGKTYTIYVTALRGEDKSQKSDPMEVTITESAQRKWSFAAFGSSVDTKNNGYIGNANDGEVTVYSENKKGKIVPNSTDGLAFYYTAIDPETENFTLTADIHVDQWEFSNGQEGFGLMAADAIGTHGDGAAFWNNSYQAVVSKVEYFHNGQEITTNDQDAKISMKLGIGTNVRLGATKEGIDAIGGNVTMPAGFTYGTQTLETSVAKNGAGTYNIIGNYKTKPDGTLDNEIVDMKLSIQRNNTGYILTYMDMDGNVIGSRKYYDLEREELTRLDKDAIYVGIFASRNAKITATNISFTTIDPKEDAPAEGREIEKISPNYKITSATTSNTAEYDLVFRGNADGTLVVTDETGKELFTKNDVKADSDVIIPTTLVYGNNTFEAVFTPDKNFVPGEYKVFENYEAATIKHAVLFKNYGTAGDTLYVSPNGITTGNGTSKNPLDIYTAVKYVQPGQTICVMEGTYKLEKTVKIERGTNGTADKKINMIADPKATTRPVFDFQGKCAGMILAGNYWYFKGFDVTESANGQKGIQVSGNHNVLDQINTYKNGNTGIQISRYLGTDQKENWPANNLILNCTSYLNADKGYEDADGFAAKLTIGEGNVFDGCISHHNADDGWDLFAKAESGPIGKVVIKNCVAYMNGYVLADDGSLINAGNGNGFKMGGESISGYHELRNSIAFDNKAKGIDSNSCPDIQVYNCVTFNNESYNVAFYTNNAKNTDFYAEGVVSYRTKHTDQAEQHKLLGTQDQSKVFGSKNFYWDTKEKKSLNKEGTAVTEDWFESLEFTSIDRNADGTINTHGFLTLTDKAMAGGVIGGQASENVTPGKETDGSITGNVVPTIPQNGTTSQPSSENTNGSVSVSTLVQTNKVATVTIPEMDVPLAQSPVLGGLPALNVNMAGNTKLGLLLKYRLQNVYLLAHLGNGVGYTIKSNDINENLSELNVGYNKETVANFAAGFQTFKLKANEEQKLTFSLDLHTNLGVQYIGKTAFIFVRSTTTGQYQLAKTMTVNEIGNVCVQTNEIADVMILVQE